MRGFRFPVRIRLRSGEFAEFVGFGGFVPGAAALQPVQPDRAVLRGDVLQDQLSDVRSLGSLLRDEDVQRLHGPCQGYVQQVDVVHVRVDHFPVIVGREERFAHAGFIPHRESADFLQLPVRAFGPDDVRRESARFGIERPVAVGDQHHLFFQSLGLVYRGDFDGRFALFDAQRAAASLFVPPFEEEGNVGYAARAEVDDLFVHGLQVGDLLPSLLKVVPHDDPFERLFGREQPQRFEKDDLLFREFRIEGGFGGEMVVNGPAQRIRRIHGQLQAGDDERTDRCRADDERLLRHHVEPVAGIRVPALEVEQCRGDFGAVRAAAHQNHHIFWAEPLVHESFDAFDEGRLASVMGDIDVAGMQPFLAGALRVFAIGLLQGVAQLFPGLSPQGVRRSLGEQLVQCRVVAFDHLADHPVVELHHQRQAPEILLQVYRFGARFSQLPCRPAVQDLPVAAPPAVDRLFDVAHDQHRGLFRLCHGVAQQGQEVFPLPGRGVLKFVDHEPVVAVADFFVDERGVVVADELREDVLGLGEHHHVLVAAHLPYFAVKVLQQGEAAVVLAQQVGGVPEADAAVVTGAQFGQQRLKLRDQRQGRRVLGAPAFRRRAHLAHGSCGCFDLSGGCGREVAREAAALAGEVGRRDASGIHEVHGPNAQFLKLLFPGFGPPRRLADDPVQFGFGTLRREGFAVAFLEYFVAQGEDAFAYVPAFAVFDALLHEGREPPLQFFVDADLFDQRIRAFGEHRGGFDFDVVVQIESQLLDESPQNALEKGIDGEDREPRIVVQDAGPGFPGPGADGPFVERQLRTQAGQVAALAARGQRVYLRQDSGSHLLGGLVGERDGQDVTVQRGLFDHVPHVFVCQLVGLARPGAGVQYSRSHLVIASKCRMKTAGGIPLCGRSAAARVFFRPHRCRWRMKAAGAGCLPAKPTFFW